MSSLNVSNSNKEQHSSLFFLFLWLIPIIAINLGYFSICKINTDINKQKQREDARQELQKLSSNSKFEVQLSRRINSFHLKAKSDLESLESRISSEKESKKDILGNHIKNLDSNTFCMPFPNHEIYYFRVPEIKITENVNSAEAKKYFLYTNVKKPAGITQYFQSFQYLVEENQKKISDNQKNRKKSLFTKLLYCDAIDTSIIATLQRGKYTPCLYKRKPHRFTWNYFVTTDKTNGEKIVYGFFFFFENEPNNENNAKKLAIKEFNSGNLSNYAAFIPIMNDSNKAFYSNDKLKNSKSFQEWIKKITPSNSEQQRDWSLRDSPENVQIGNYTAYTQLNANTAHLCVILIPTIKETNTPIWLYALNLLSVSAFILIACKGMLFNLWPVFTLKHRFTLSFSLASAFPLSLFIVSLFGYISYYQNAQYLQGISHLKSCLNSFDTKKTKIIENYRDYFNKILNDSELIELLKKHGSSSEQVAKRLQFFCDKYPNKLPITHLALFDQGSNGIYLSCESENKTKTQKIKYSTLDTEKERNESYCKIDKLLEQLIYPLSILIYDAKKREQANNPNLDFNPEYKPFLNEEQKRFNDTYETVAGKELYSDIKGRKNHVMLFQTSPSEANVRLFNFITINNIESFALIMRWNYDAIDKKAYKENLTKITLENPDFTFGAFFNNIYEGLMLYDEETQLNPPDSNQSLLAFQSSIKQAAYNSNESKSMYYTKPDKNNLYFCAMPSTKYTNLVFVGAGSMNKCFYNIKIAMFTAFAVLIISILLIIKCISLSSKIVIKPIEKNKQALDRISKGDLEISIISNSYDELGLLSKEFSSMIQGLRERKQLATLISDSALSAISSGTLETSTFHGVALVSDIRNFTGTCESQPAQLVTDLLNAHFAKMALIIAQHGGKIYKFIGDAIEAVFPEDNKYEQSAPKRAFLAATQMIAQLSAINKNRKNQNLFPYKIGIGLKYGQMYSGAIGSLDTRLDYAILGDPLKQAAKLEALSVQTPDFPVVLDDYIVKELAEFKLDFKPLENSEFPACIVLNHNSLKNLSENNFQNSDDHKTYQSKNKKQINIYTDFGINYSKSKKLIYSGVSFIITISLGILFGYNLVAKHHKNAQISISEPLIIRSKEQLSINNIQRLMFENKCRRLFKKCEVLINNKAQNKEIIEIIKDYSKQIGLKRFLFVKTLNPIIDSRIRTLKKSKPIKITSKGFSENSISNLIKCAYANRNPNNNAKQVFKTPPVHVRNDGSSNTFISIVNDDTDSLEREQEYVFWEYLYDYKSDNPDYSVNSLGSLFVTASKKDFDSSIQQFADGFEDINSNIYIALKEENNNSNWIQSENFPKELIKEYDTNPKIIAKTINYVSDDGYICLNNKTYKYILASKLFEKDFYAKSALFVFIGLFLFFSISVLKRINEGTSSINKSVGQKLWLANIVAALIPMISLLIVFQLYLNEMDYTLSAQKQTELQDFALKFEERANFFNSLGWHEIEKISKSKSFSNAVDQTLADKEKTNVISPELLNKEFIDKIHWIEEKDRWTNSYNPVRANESGTIKSNINLIPFLIKELMVSGNGWSITKGITTKVPEKENKTNILCELFGLIGQTQIGICAPEKTSNKISANDIVSEEFADRYRADEGKVLANILGIDLYLNLPYSVNIPTLLRANEVKMGVVSHICRTEKNIPYNTIWLVLFDRIFANIASDYNKRKTNLSNAAKANDPFKEYDDGIRIYPTDEITYNKIHADNNVKHSLLLKKIAAYVSTSKNSISSQIKTENGTLFYEARPCLSMPDFLTVTISDKKSIDNEINKNKEYFCYFFLTSIIIIILISRNVAQDIIAPIKKLTDGIAQIKKDNYSYRINIDRKDELGDLCNSFDSMTKGLEEKQIIEKMISNTAQKTTLNEIEWKKSQKTNCILLYISAINFASNTKKCSPSQIIQDLKKQIIYIAQSVMEEGGEIDKIMAEKQLIVFHTKDRGLNEAINAACRTSLSIINKEQNEILPYKVAVGISYGEVIAGFLGVGEKRDFTVIGDPVNVSARISSFAEKEPDKHCLISEKVYEIAHKSFTTELVGEISLKGKSKPMKVYNLISNITCKTPFINLK